MAPKALSANEIICRYGAAAALWAVALIHLYRVEVDGASQWKGGGFGMFSTIDAGGVRQLSVRIATERGTFSASVASPELATTAKAFRNHPSRARAQAISGLLKEQVWRLSPPRRTSIDDRVREFLDGLTKPHPFMRLSGDFFAFGHELKQTAVPYSPGYASAMKRVCLARTCTLVVHGLSYSRKSRSLSLHKIASFTIPLKQSADWLASRLGLSVEYVEEHLLDR